MGNLSTTLTPVKRRLRNLLAFVVLAVTAWMCFDNVFSDDAPIRELAEKAACTHKGAKACDEQHGLVREQRMPWAQSIDYAWRDATLHVSCHREFYVFGERRCAVE
jgi:hypothetical protein